MCSILISFLLSTTSIETTQFIIINDEQLNKFQIDTDDSEPGKTGYSGFEHLHVNLCNLTYGKIGALLSIYKESSNRSELAPKLQKQDVKKYISEAKHKGLINEELTNPDLLKDINKYC